MHFCQVVGGELVVTNANTVTASLLRTWSICNISCQGIPLGISQLELLVNNILLRPHPREQDKLCDRQFGDKVFEIALLQVLRQL